MTRVKINEAICKLRDLLINDRARPIQCPDDQYVIPRDQKDHCLWMCERVLANQTPDNKLFSDDKAMRWLCFVQGVVWSCCLRSIKQLKEDNRDETIPPSPVR